MKKSILVIFFCGILFRSFSQKAVISGYVFDDQTGEKLIGAAVYSKKTYKGCETNNYGFYSIKANLSDTITLVFSYIGFYKEEKNIVVKSDLHLDVKLNSSTELKEVVVSAPIYIPFHERAEMSTIEIPMKNISAMPTLFGEVNVLKALQFLPGVQFGNEGNSAIYVRGGGHDQNLILLDEVPLYNVSHYGGFYSLFNPDAISNVTLIKGGFPARYDGRLSSVLDVHMKEGNKQEFKTSGTIGMLTSKLMVEGPILKNKTSFMLSGRRSMFDAISIMTMNDEVRQGMFFYDANAKINHQFNEKNHIYFSFYKGDDGYYSKTNPKKTSYISNTSVNWGNTAIALRYSHVFSKNIFTTLSGIYSKYRANEEYFFEKDKYKTIRNTNSYIEDYSLKLNTEIYVTNFYEIKIGTQYTRHKFNPGVYAYRFNNELSTAVDTTFKSPVVTPNKINTYLENKFNFRKFNANTGLHLSSYEYNNNFYQSLEPRLSVNWLFHTNTSFKASYCKMQQYIHLLTSGGIGSTSDLWVPATDYAKPEVAHQIATGFSYYLKKYELDFSLEGYHKNMTNLIEYKDGVTYYSNNNDWQEKIETNGVGEAYGVEFFVQKKTGRFTGWLGYTWSRNYRQFDNDNINFGKPYLFRYDRTHDINIVVNYKIKKRLDISATWVYATGNAVTLPTGKYPIINSGNGKEPYNYETEAHIYEGKNTFRMPAYHRLDVGMNYIKKKKRYTATWNFSIHNVYNRRNISYYQYYDYDSDGNTDLNAVTWFPFMPSISYSFKF